MCRQDDWLARQLNDWHQVLRGIDVRFEYVWLTRCRVDSNEDGVAIRRALGRRLNADGSIGARFVFNIHLLADRARQVFGDDAGAHVGRPTCRKRYDEPDWLGGI